MSTPYKQMSEENLLKYFNEWQAKEPEIQYVQLPAQFLTDMPKEELASLILSKQMIRVVGGQQDIETLQKKLVEYGLSKFII